MRVPNQDIEQPTHCQGPVGVRFATVKLEPTWTSNFLREHQEADADLKVIIGWKKAIEGERVVLESCCKDLSVTVRTAALHERCVLPKMGK